MGASPFLKREEERVVGGRGGKRKGMGGEKGGLTHVPAHGLAKSGHLQSGFSWIPCL